MHKFEKWVLEYIECHQLLSRGDKVVVAVSGGADSICLLQILNNISENFDISLHVAHLDHCIRGESYKDAEYVALIAEQLDLPSTIEERDVLRYRQEHHISLEEAAREVRYQFLEEVVKSQGASSVAVAHTLNDHVETVLLHLLRGSGLKGLVGLRRRSILKYKRVGPLQVIRPLLCLNREEIEEYCKEKGLEYRTDASNESLSMTRNRIRLKLLPRLRKDFNPRIDDAIAKLSRLADDDVDFIEKESTAAANKISHVDNNVTVIDKIAFLKLHPSLRRGILRQVLSVAVGSPKDIEAIHIDDMMDVAESDAGSSIDLLDGLTFTVGYKELMLGRDLTEIIPLAELEGQYTLDIPGVTEIPGWRVTGIIIDSGDYKESRIIENPLVQEIDYGVATDSLTVRSRIPGDRFHPFGMETEKTIKDFFIDAKVPRPWRPRVPIVVNPSHIVWVVGYRPDDRVKITATTRKVLRLKFEKQVPILPVSAPEL